MLLDHWLYGIITEVLETAFENGQMTDIARLQPPINGIQFVSTSVNPIEQKKMTQRRQGAIISPQIAGLCRR